MREHLAGYPVGLSTYTNHGCRCDGCKGAAREYGRARRAGRARPRGALALLLHPDRVAHGTVRGYRTQGCRCEKCKAANATYQREYRARRRAREATKSMRE
jgi:hypothetical protein